MTFENANLIRFLCTLTVSFVYNVYGNYIVGWIHITSLDFKNVHLLSLYINPQTGRIYSRHVTCENLECGKKQREISKAIKKAMGKSSNHSLYY
uniref:Uncharacterized protein n=1 Tax=Oncorhynchus mykiss TaxID=8022 RepID=A0A8C7S2X1_ONCMY